MLCLSSPPPGIGLSQGVLMRFLRLVSLAAVLASAILFAEPGSAQPDPLVRHWPGVVLTGQTQIAEAGAQLEPAGKKTKTKVRFDAAVAYDSAGAFADSVAIADLNGDG